MRISTSVKARAVEGVLMMSRTGDAVQMLLGLALVLAGIGFGFTWTGAAAVAAGIAIGAHGIGRAAIRARETRDL